MTLFDVIKTIVENLQYSLVFRITKELENEDMFVARQELDRISDSDLMSDPESLYMEARMYFINRAIDDKEISKTLVQIPELLDVELKFDAQGIHGEDIISLAKDTSIITLMLYMIPKTVIGPSTLPQEFRQQGVDIIVKHLLGSNNDRKKVFTSIENELRSRKMVPLKFDMESILTGYNIEPEKSEDFISSLCALTLIISTGLSFTRDELLELPRKILARETTSFILTMHAQGALRKYIAGSGRKKPFDWPITGDKKSCTQVMNLLDIVRDITSSLRTCPIFVIELMSQKMKMSYEDYIVFFLEELILHYEETLKNRRGKGRNEKLRQFIKSIKDEKRSIARRLLESEDKGSMLAKELRDFNLKAKGEFRSDITPEARYLEHLRSLDGKLRIKSRSENFSFELVDYLRPVFESISEMVKKNEADLREDVFKFTDALCFQTCFQILEYVKLGDNLTDLPWISRFIAEEAVRSSISSGELQVLGEEHRIKRIIAAYLGGLSYLILQAQN